MSTHNEENARFERMDNQQAILDLSVEYDKRKIVKEKKRSEPVCLVEKKKKILDDWKS